ncbi:hypothetical protein BJ085DRAFT_14939 [Dimargaris cristalligena]|uniref:non-specific serine/threonine protein kinase n=1 Tax=Dimargaris cristalligena TaxID=215637 RepID=A0A4P9ZUR1_9FUNG|nr:hypothetical protein BJ085DRAFT_14939 [Dimargaris cristalligena]|eukprot:RKP36998.1 hypothetical protein BJ085DRAFT_14939 [Dimargaris cristalligena]
MRPDNCPLLGPILKALLERILQSNLYLRSVAYTQLETLARVRQTTLPDLFRPFSAAFSVFLTQCWEVQPAAADRAMRLLGQPLAQFLTQHLDHILPELFAMTRDTTLMAVAQVLQQDLPVLCINHAHTILSHLFLLPSDRVPPAMRLFLTVATRDSHNITLTNIIRSCSLQLVIRLTDGLGDSDNAQRARAANALRMVLEKLDDKGGPPTPTATDTNPLASLLLNKYFLGILTHMNELLSAPSSMVPSTGSHSPGHKARDTVTSNRKCRTLRSLIELIKLVGPAIQQVASHINATLRATLVDVDLRDATLEAWHALILSLKKAHLAPHLNHLLATFGTVYPHCTPRQCTLIHKTLDYLLLDSQTALAAQGGRFCLLPTQEEAFVPYNLVIWSARGSLSIPEHLQLLNTIMADENQQVAELAVAELRELLLKYPADVHRLVVAERIDPSVVHTIQSLLRLCTRINGAGRGAARCSAECLGLLGAIDPTRLTAIRADPTSEFTAEVRSSTDRPPGYDLATADNRFDFMCYFLETYLVHGFRSAKTPQEQGYFAYAIQELLKECRFTPQTVVRAPDERDQILYRRWMMFPEPVRDTLQTLLDTKYSIHPAPAPDVRRPIFPEQTDHRIWLKKWVLDLIAQIPIASIRDIFGVCRNVIRYEDDNQVALFVLPYLLLLTLSNGREKSVQNAVEEVQTILASTRKDSGTGNYPQLCAQTLFHVIDQFNLWAIQEQQQVRKPSGDLPPHPTTGLSNRAPISPVSAAQARLQIIPQPTLASAAMACGVGARAIQHLENAYYQLESSGDKQGGVEFLRMLLQVYSQMNDSDGTEGVSTLLPHVTTDDQIVLFESTGRWISAQACYELKLKQKSDSKDTQLGFARCLKNMGHLESLLTHIRGLLAEHEDWQTELQPLAAEAAWRLGKWDALEDLLPDSAQPKTKAISRYSFEVALGRLLLSLRHADRAGFQNLLDETREWVLTDLAVASKESYLRSYPEILRLHMLRELEAAAGIQPLVLEPSPTEHTTDPTTAMETLFQDWERRLDVTMPLFPIREPILSLRRVITRIVRNRTSVSEEYARMWLLTAKNARKDGYLQTAFSALLSASEVDENQVSIERAKWYWASQQSRLAFRELQQAIERHTQHLTLPPKSPTTNPGQPEGTTPDSAADKFIIAKSNLLLAKWLVATSGSSSSTIIAKFDEIVRLQPRWEKAFVSTGRYYNKFLSIIKQRDQLPGSGGSDQSVSVHPEVVIYLICRNYSKALTFGSKYIYQTMPRLLTVWLNFGAEVDAAKKTASPAAEERLRFLSRINNTIQSMAKRQPTYQFLTAFPQIVSWILHPNDQVFAILENIIISVLIVFPHQALWAMIAVAQSTVSKRANRCFAIFAKVKSDPTAMYKRLRVGELIEEATHFTNALTDLCNHPVPAKVTTLSFNKEFRRLMRMTPLNLLVPLQSSLTVTLPTSSQTLMTHNPFPGTLPAISGFQDTIEVLHSLQKPKKLTILGSDGQSYTFLCKPKDDLRKDARTMEFNTMINKLLLKDTESRRRQLHIRTYAVIPLSEDCGLIEWVPHTTGFRHIIMNNYRRRNCMVPMARIRTLLERTDPAPAEVFEKQILPLFPPVFHEWFLARFPDPSEWLVSRQHYIRTTAVMSMVGFILGLGDRHGENILFDETNGDCVHVDFSCLFEKGLTLEKPERVPFRLTHNMVRAMGVTGYEGPFRRTCEVTMTLLRAHRDSLMCVLETFLLDPLCEWSRPTVAAAGRSAQRVAAVEAQNRLAVINLSKIKRKLDGWLRNSIPISVEGQVDHLISQATSSAELFHMYIGWAAYL